MQVDGERLFTTKGAVMGEIFDKCANGCNKLKNKIVKYLFFSTMFSTSSVCLSKTSNGFKIYSRFVIFYGCLNSTVAGLS